MSHDERRHLLGGYVLGGLSADDRAEIEAHLAGCAECRDELAAFSPIPGLLGRTPEPHATSAPDVLPGLLEEVRRARAGRRRRTVLTGLVAAALVLVAGSLAVWGWASDPSPAAEEPSAVLALEPAPTIEADGSVALMDRAWGTAVLLEADGLPRSGDFVLEVVGTDGTVQSAATWSATYSGRCRVDGATSLARDQIRTIRVVGPDGAVATASPASAEAAVPAGLHRLTPGRR